MDSIVHTSSPGKTRFFIDLKLMQNSSTNAAENIMITTNRTDDNSASQRIGANN